MIKKLSFILYFLLFTSLSFAQVMSPTFSMNVSDDDSTVWNPTSIGFPGTDVTQEGNKAIVRISGGVTDHGGLTGLLDDDHTIYFLADGTRVMGGTLDMSANVIDNATTINASTNVSTPKITFGDNNTAPTAVGEFLYDNTVAGFTDGLFTWYDDDEIRYLADFATLPGIAQDDYVLAYDKDLSGLYFKASAGGGDITRVGDCLSGECLVTGGNVTMDGATVNTTLTLDYATASEILGTNASKEAVSLAVATYPSLAELAYVKGLDQTLAQSDNVVFGTVNKVTITAPATGSTLTIEEGFTLTVDGNATVQGTNTGDNDEVNTKNTGDLCTNDGTNVECTVNTIAELETALDAEDIITKTEGDLAYAPIAVTDEVGTLNTGDICTNDGSDVQCTVNTEAEFETAMDGIDFMTVSADDFTSANFATACSDEDGTGDCAADKVCMGGHTHTVYGAVAGQVWTGDHGFGGSTQSLEIPNDAAVTDPNVAGEVAIDTTTDQFLYYGGAQRILTYRYTDCRTLETPVDADDDIPVWAFPEARTITDVHCWTEGGTSIAVTISDGTDALEAVTCDADGADDDGSIANGTFTANENIEWDFAAPTGTVDWVKICITTTITAD